VIRPGFVQVGTQKVLRKAQVRRYVYMPSAEEYETLAEETTAPAV
jgi:hypothetical protein